MPFCLEDDHSYAARLRPNTTLENDDENNLRNTRCAACKSDFEFHFHRRRKRRYLKRYSLKLLGLSESQFAQGGDFVCPSCRNNFLRKTPSKRSATATRNDKAAELDSVKHDHSFAKQSSQAQAKSLKRSSAPSKSALRNAEGLLTSPPRTPPRPQAYKRPNDTPLFNTPKRAASSRDFQPTSSRLKFKEPTIELIKRSRYSRALREMYQSKNRAVTSAMIQFCAQTVSKEVAAFCRKPAEGSHFSGKFSSERLKQFTWQKALAEAKLNMPMLTAALLAVFPGAKATSRVASIGRRKCKRCKLIFVINAIRFSTCRSLCQLNTCS